MAKPELTIKFKADSKSLEQALKNLNAGTDQLKQATVLLTNTQKNNHKTIDVAANKIELNKAAFQKLSAQLKKANKNYKDIGISVNVMSQAAFGSSKALAVFKRAMGQANLTVKKTTKNLRLQSGSFATLRSNLLLYSFGVGLAQAALISFVEKSSKVEDLERGFKGLVGGIGGSIDSLNKLQQATDNTVSKTDLLKEANNAMMLGVVKSDDEMAELFDTAQRLGQALGVDTKDAINSMVTGMGRQSKLMLDNLGIVVDTDKAYEKYAEKIKISKNELTDAQKKEAFNQEVLRVSGEIVDNLGTEYLSTGAQLQRMATATHDLSVSIGQALTPIVHVLANAMVFLSKHFDADKLKMYAAAVGVVGLAYLSTAKGMAVATKMSMRFLKANKAMMLAMLAITVVAEVLDSIFDFMGMDELEEGFEGVTDATNETNEAFEKNAEILKKLNLETNYAVALLQLRNAGEEASGSISEKIAVLDVKRKAILEKMNKGLGDQTELTIELWKTNTQLLNLKVDKKDKERADALKDLNEQEKLNLSIIKLRNAEEGFSGDVAEKMQFLNEKKAIIQEKISKGLVDQKDVQAELNNINAEYINLKVDLVDERKAEALKTLNEETKANITLLKSKNIEDGVSGTTAEKLQVLAIKKAALETQLNESLGEQIDVQEELNTVNGEIHDIEMERHQQKIANAIEMANAVGSIIGKSAELEMQQSKAAQKEAINAANSIRNERIRQKEIDKINKKFAEEQEKINEKSKRAKKTQTIINTSVGIMEVWADKEAGLFAKIAMSALVAAAGAQQIKTIDAQKYQYGGLVGGRRHSQGGTMIEAEQGEFVMSREATEAVGIENLNRMNAGLGGGGGASIVINNPVLGKDTIEDEIVPQIKEALRRGGSIA